MGLGDSWAPMIYRERVDEGRKNEETPLQFEKIAYFMGAVDDGDHCNSPESFNGPEHHLAFGRSRSGCS